MKDIKENGDKKNSSKGGSKMLERKVTIYNQSNLRKRLKEFMNESNHFMESEKDSSSIYKLLYGMELFRNAIYQCIKVNKPMLPDAPLPNTEEGISEYEDEYSDEILKIKIYELLPPVRTPYNNKRLERTCQLIGEKYKGLFQNKEVIIRVQVSVPRDNWDIDNRDLRYIFNGFVYGGLISDDNIQFVSYMLEGINDHEDYIKIFISEKKNIQKVSGIEPQEYFENV